MMTQSLSSSSSSSSLTAQNPNLYPVPFFSKSTNFGFFDVSRLSPTPNFSRNRLAVKCRQGEYLNQQSTPPNSSSSLSSQPSPRGPVSGSPRYFVGHSIYKGKAALTVQPVAPEFTVLDSGAFKLTKEGYVLLQFAPAAGVRVYDWGRKQVFSLSVTEIGNLVSLGSRESCEFYHDPYKGKSEEGQVRKVLKVEPLQDRSGHFFNLSVQNKLINVDENIHIPVTKAEYAVLNAAFNFMLPYFLGWHAFASSARMVDDTNRGTNNANPGFGGDYEWNR